MQLDILATAALYTRDLLSPHRHRKTLALNNYLYQKPRSGSWRKEFYSTPDTKTQHKLKTLTAFYMKEKILSKLLELLAECNTLIDRTVEREKSHVAYVNDGGTGYAKFNAFRTSALYFLEQIVGRENIYYKKFDRSTIYHGSHNLIEGFELLSSLKNDVEQGWLKDLRGLISAEIFSDFLEMAEHLLDEDYKDPAAVIIGSILEENLRTLCHANKISTSTPDLKTGKLKYLKAESMNVELCKAGIYNTLVQKSVTAWLDLRNKAAHGDYPEYDITQVKNLLQNVRDFAVKYS